METKPADNNLEFDSNAQAKSLRAVLLYNLAETFDLVDEEIIWVRQQLDTLVSLLSNHQPSSPTLSMITEIRNGTYSSLLSLRAKAHTPRGNVSSLQAANKKTPTLDDWIEALSQPIELAYPGLSSHESIQIRSSLSYILRNIGIGDPTSPRGCTRMPIELKLILAEKEFSTVE